MTSIAATDVQASTFPPPSHSEIAATAERSVRPLGEVSFRGLHMRHLSVRRHLAGTLRDLGRRAVLLLLEGQLVTGVCATAVLLATAEAAHWAAAVSRGLTESFPYLPPSSPNPVRGGAA
ncbi:hypothetical protein [Streptomyces sp. A5-4]|uniref:hypothetical protein n=1 Tax=Streptomyces sp. A5-4 TaxID=3384771 RepID=UPI003DA83DA9